MRHEQMLITPALAEQFLKANVVNRKHIRKTWVEALAKEMQQGTFTMTHQGIAFNTDGKLLDGQHRLSAVVKSGCSVMMDVAFDCVANTAMEWPVDRGKSRSVADTMQISATEAAIVDCILAIWRKNRMAFTTKDRHAVWELFRIHIATINGMCSTARKTLSQVAIRVPAMLRVLRHGEQPGRQYRALVLLDFSEMWPSVQSLTRQLTINQKKEAANSVMARAWIAFDPDRRNVSRIQINDPSTQLSEMREVLAEVGLKDALGE